MEVELFRVQPWNATIAKVKFQCTTHINIVVFPFVICGHPRYCVLVGKPLHNANPSCHGKSHEYRCRSRYYCTEDDPWSTRCSEPQWRSCGELELDSARNAHRPHIWFLPSTANYVVTVHQRPSKRSASLFFFEENDNQATYTGDYGGMQFQFGPIKSFKIRDFHTVILYF